MLIDQGILAVGGLAATILGVFATFLAPRVRPRNSIDLDVNDVSRVGSGKGASSLTVEVLHEGVRVDSPVYIFKGYVENTGAKDITSAEFVEPVVISFVEGFKLLSGETVSPKGVNSTMKIFEREAHVRWSMLKPYEVISLSIIATADAEKDDFSPNEVTIPVARLKDVRMARRWTPVQISSALMVSMLTIVFTIAGFSIANVYKQTSTVHRFGYSDVSGLRWVKINELPPVGPQLCRETAQGKEVCSAIEGAPLADVIARSRTIETRSKVSFVGLAAISLMAILYITAIAMFMYRFVKESRKNQPAANRYGHVVRARAQV